MTQPTVSIIVVSRGRPLLLVRCLKALFQLQYSEFEIIVVADGAGFGAVESAGFSDSLKLVRFDEANISAARNIGIRRANGDLVAFIDDDAAAEAGWLHHLSQPFEDELVMAAGGFVRGRNGISFQSQGQTVDELGKATALVVVGIKPVVLRGKVGYAIKTEGTNCAFRRKYLMSIGGFDTAYQFYLDETDVNMRLALSGKQTAIVPLAQVHHGFESSDKRQQNRVPQSLFEVGASTVVYLRKYAEELMLQDCLNDLRARYRKAQLRHMIAGRCEPRDVEIVLKTLDAGISAGWERDLKPLEPLETVSEQFDRVKDNSPRVKPKCLAGYKIQERKLRKQAKNLVEQGIPVSLFCFSRTALFHRIRYDSDGYWVHSGGILGKADRKGRMFSMFSLAKRAKYEKMKINKVRYPLSGV